MISCIVIPTAKRPEMLALCLERLQEIPNCPPVLISIDTANTILLDETLHVRDTRYPSAQLHCQSAHPATRSGCWNILHSLKLGYETGAKYIFMLEDDVQIYPNWLSWHLEQMKSGKYLATCGRKHPLFYPKHPDVYTNTGSCLHRLLVANVIPHINNDYFADQSTYLDRAFGTGDRTSNLDDGLIRCVIKQLGGRCAYPDQPTCAHQGFEWYNIVDIFMNRGNIEERIAGLKELHRKFKENPQRYSRYNQDFEPYNPTS